MRVYLGEFVERCVGAGDSCGSGGKVVFVEEGGEKCCWRSWRGVESSGGFASDARLQIRFDAVGLGRV